MQPGHAVYVIFQTLVHEVEFSIFTQNFFLRINFFEYTKDDILNPRFTAT